MGCVGCAVGVEGVVGIAVVGNDDGFVAHLFCCLNHFVHTLVNGLHCGLDGRVYAGVTHHVAVGKVHHNPVILACLDGVHELILHLVGRHLGLQVVCGHLGRVHQYAVFSCIGFLASAVEEESHVCILLGLGRVQLLEALAADVFAQCVLYVLLGEENVQALERCVVRSHAVVLQAGYGLHALFRHVLLCEDDGQFLGPVVAVVVEDDDVALLDASVDVGVDEGLHEFVGVLMLLGVAVVASLHGLYHVGALPALALDELVVGHLDAVPALVAVHGIESAYDAGYGSCAYLVDVLLQVGDEALARLRVGVASVHEAVYVAVLYAILLGYVYQFQDVAEAGVYAACGREAHEVYGVPGLLGIAVCRLYLGVLQYAAVGTGSVDFHEVLVYDAAGSDVEMPHLRVAHLSVGQTNVFAAGL